MSTEDRTAATFDEARAEGYDVKIREVLPAYEVLHEAVYQVLVPHLDATAHLLIAGAGTGAEVVKMGRRQPGWHFTAVDPSPEMLQRCRAKVAEAGLAGRVTFVNLPMADVEPATPFDAATSICIAHFIQDPAEKQRYFDTIAAHLKPNAPFVFADLFGDPETATFAQWFQVWRAHYQSAGVPEDVVAEHFAQIEANVSFVPESILADVLAGAGFEPLRRFYQYYLWGAWFTRLSPKPQ